jgi:Tfp pilus assembly protein PilN
VLRYSRSDTRLATQASHDEARAAELRQQAARLRGSVDPKQVDYAAADARQANELIDRRTFSWTELFNRFETTLPDDVRIASVRPRLDRDHGFVLVINVMARSVDDVNTFIINLENTGAFMNIRPADERTDETGMLQSSLEAVYLPTAGKPAIRGGRR